MPISIPRRPVAAAALVLLAAACGRGEREEAAAVRMDTANTSWEDGLSSQQVESEARALSPEEAEAAGLAVDTTIHLEVRDEQDTLYLPRTNQPTPPPVDPSEHDTLRGVQRP